MILNHAGFEDFPDYKLVVNRDMMARVGKISAEQVSKGSFQREAEEAREDTDVYIFLKYFKIVPYSKPQASKDRTKGEVLAKKLIDLSKEHFSDFLSASGKSFQQQKWKDWYEERKEKLGTIPIHTWDHGNKPNLNVQIKVVPKFEKD